MIWVYNSGRFNTLLFSEIRNLWTILLRTTFFVWNFWYLIFLEVFAKHVVKLIEILRVKLLIRHLVLFIFIPITITHLWFNNFNFGFSLPTCLFHLYFFLLLLWLQFSINLTDVMEIDVCRFWVNLWLKCEFFIMIFNVIEYLFLVCYFGNVMQVVIMWI